MIKIIDNKKIDLTESEYQLYQDLVKAYSGPGKNGAEQFKDLFETDDQGLIIFLKPPTRNYSSMECYLFIVNVMIHQHLGNSCARADLALKEVKSFLIEAQQMLEEGKVLIAELKSRDSRS